MSGVVEPWDGKGDYVHPFKPGDWVSATRGGSVVIGRVVRTDGYGPNIVGLEHIGAVDLTGWYVGVCPAGSPSSTYSPWAPCAPAAPDGPTLPV